MDAQSCLTLCDPMDCSPPGSSCPWNFPGKNTGVGCHFVLQGIFLTQGSSPHLLHLLHWGRQILYHKCNLEDRNPSESESKSRSVMPNSL